MNINSPDRYRNLINICVRHQSSVWSNYMRLRRKHKQQFFTWETTQVWVKCPCTTMSNRSFIFRSTLFSFFIWNFTPTGCEFNTEIVSIHLLEFGQYTGETVSRRSRHFVSISIHIYWSIPGQDPIVESLNIDNSKRPLC